MKAFRNAKIAGTGSYAPPKVLTNQDLEKMVDTTDEWIVTRTGIRERRIADDKTASSDMAFAASREALDDAGMKPEEIDRIIVGTITPDRLFPSAACTLQELLGASKACAFDISAACSGFIYGLSIGRVMIAAGEAETILVVGVETLSKITDWNDRNTCVLFGDGAGAAVLRPCGDDAGILSICLGSDGTLGSLLELPAGGSRIPASKESVENGLHFLKMKGNEVFKSAVRAMGDIAEEAIAKAGISADEISLLIPHQANLRIIQATAKRLGIPMDKVLVTLEKYGNTSAASIPMALNEARKSGRVKKGDLIVLAAFGGGFTWGGCVIRC
ncbi:MAG: beta-ketoacyl-ACP synthase III [Candidatus Eisenbacteria bacterium]|nr:beta-ketoacyl-ACP synthase III [Candidatus Eisenbacteria bacterium]